MRGRMLICEKLDSISPSTSESSPVHPKLKIETMIRIQCSRLQLNSIQVAPHYAHVQEPTYIGMGKRLLLNLLESLD